MMRTSSVAGQVSSAHTKVDETGIGLVLGQASVSRGNPDSDQHAIEQLRYAQEQLRQIKLELAERETERKRTAEDRARERKQLEAEVLQISDREQQRIARDLHDGLGQLLSGTVHLANVLQLELAEQALPEAAEALRILELLNLAVSETRTLARGLYPVRPEANGLVAALQELAARTQELFKVGCRLRCGKPVLVADKAVATHLYRIAQEAVANAIKHGHPSQIQITLAATYQRIVLTIRDNGIGLKTEAPGAGRKGMGMRIMQYRAEMIGATLRIEPARSRGLAVICTVSLHPAPARPPGSG
jgi:signal transduction histidine kinase